MKHILIIDDDMDMCQLLSNFLKRKGFTASSASSGKKGLEAVKENRFDLVLCDFRLGDMDGKEVLQQIKAVEPSMPVVILTGYSDVKMAVEVMRLGAFDYITKPLVPEEIIKMINKALDEDTPASPVAAANGRAEKKDKEVAGDDDIMIGKDKFTLQMYKDIQVVAPTDYSIIIYGESGTGKEVIAKTIHQNSKRRNKPFMAVDCGTISRELAASELFGHVKGSFTGAFADKVGFFEAANGGTIFLDEIANLPLDVQVVLLRVIQERKFKKVGDSRDIETDVRIIVASNENLQDAYKAGKFREDLYHRFNEFSISIPPLRKRKDDIIPFANFFLEKTSKELGKSFDGFEDEVLQLFLNYDWPGNLREFRNVIRRASLLSSSGKINSNVLAWEIVGSSPSVAESTTNSTSTAAHADDMTESSTNSDEPVFDLKNAASDAEYKTILHALKQVKFNKVKAAKLLNIDRKTLYNKLKNYEL
ncbi:MAG: sigma-54-dependent Fis family transcriptional regulator [Chitinophagaceae bacterium]|nr:MAG: sigma-54-dependent Fis family transcriptional regulator [Chitinophagaceae bacterium]